MLKGWDLATILCGWAYGDGSQVPVASAIRLPQCDDDIGLMLHEFDKAVNANEDDHPSTHWVFEAPILPSNRKKGAPGAVMGSLLQRRKQLAIYGHLEFIAYRRGIICVEVDLQEMKRELGGRNNAEKADMVAAAEKVGVRLPRTNDAGKKDAADAFAAWLIGVRHYAKPYSSAWDRRLYRARGALL